MFLSLCSGPSINNMAARLFNAIGKVGIGLAVAGGVVQSALYNGETLMFYSRKRFICLLGKMHSCFCLCGSILLTPKDTAECHVWLSVCLRLLSPILLDRNGRFQLSGLAALCSGPYYRLLFLIERKCLI